MLLFTAVCQTKVQRFIFTDAADLLIRFCHVIIGLRIINVEARKKIMNRNCIKDDELENVNGGRRTETDELHRVFHTGNINNIKRILSEHGIETNIFNDSNDNIYVIKGTTQALTHKQLMELIYKNEWYK